MPEAIKSRTVKRSIAVAGRKTSVNLEDACWYALRRIASDRGMTIGELIAAIDAERQQGNRSSAIRRFVLGFPRAPTKADPVRAPARAPTPALARAAQSSSAIPWRRWYATRAR